MKLPKPFSQTQTQTERRDQLIDASGDVRPHVKLIIPASTPIILSTFSKAPKLVIDSVKRQRAVSPVSSSGGVRSI